MNNDISFTVYGRYALFSDPVTRVGGEKCSYHIPTYEALKGIVKSIYWKPTLIWVIDKVRILRPFRTQTKGVKPIRPTKGSNDLSIYTYLADVAYQVKARFVWNEHRPELKQDRIEGKHYEITKRMLARGGRQDIFLGTRDCQGYVEPCRFGEGPGAYDDLEELAFGLMFHGFDYPDETGNSSFGARFWKPVMRKGIIEFPSPDDASLLRKEIRPMKPKAFHPGKNYAGCDEEALSLLLQEPETVAYPDVRSLLSDGGPQGGTL
ncbi:type I-C CRISPR-associated protein Cas5 [Desulfovibrio sp. UIB00]|uniref:type I-C CRISPR-associated protein Cas5c n=1 Tax=Desulfovibrio sp. UIB00 TaxID=2804314 RepID=UPI001F0F2910|nr:type I-C CRISPR-associated protein Cas5 [Desulfovibrio sp. UIB00]